MNPLNPMSFLAYFDLETFSSDLRAQIARRQKSYEQVAQESGVHKNTICYLARNSSKSPGIHVVMALLIWGNLDIRMYIKRGRRKEL